MTVFVVQDQKRLDKETGKLVSVYPSIYKAKKWGNLEFILPSDSTPFRSDHLIGLAHEKLSGFSNDDFLLLIGNPVLMGFCTTLCSYYNEGYVKFLQWSGENRSYRAITLKMF